MNMQAKFKSFCNGLVLSAGFLPAIWASPALAAFPGNLSGRQMADFTSTPVATVESVTPLVMLAMSMDHQYWFKAYNDYTDLEGDGDVERTYDDTFQYYGYFHAERCYRFTDATTIFTAVGKTSGANLHYCEGSLDNAWSGNFLNWATMTRMDIVRKILYGGQRQTDTATDTVLERTHLPGDAHSFAKYYNGPDIKKLVPYTTVLADDTASGGDGDGFDDAAEGITICNISYQSNGSSQAATALPMMRVVNGNRQLWGANERRQCTWENENGDNGNSNDVAQSGIDAISSDPPDALQLKTPGNARDHIVRVKVCVNDSLYDDARNLENCKPYNTNLKPEGLLQRYGLDGQINFGLITGSYQKNISGGVLRKKIGSLLDEVNVGNGTFITGAATAPGIIKTLNAVRVWGYGYNAGTYRSADSGGDDCDFQLTNISTEGKCASWGNPMSEIYLEALRYFTVSGAARAPSAAFNANDSTYITGLVQDSWTADPLSADNACAALNTIVFNASVSSYDDDQTNLFSGITATPTAAALTKSVGDGEGITGNSFFIGRAGSATNEFCTSKTVNSLGDAFGLCPEAPTVRGSYHMAGMAYYARTNDLRPALDGDQTVRTFAVSLATSTPVIEIPVGATPTAASPKVRILPAYRLRKGGNATNEALNNPTNDGGGALVDFKIVRPHTQVSAVGGSTPSTTSKIFSGKFYINWEDSEQGGDYDQDMWGTLEYWLDNNFSPARLTVTTNAVAQSTSIAQLFGFVTSGTTQDGFHAYSGILGGNFTDSAPVEPTLLTSVRGCSNCRALNETGGQRGAQSYTFVVNPGGAADLLESPLFYAAKWGGFVDQEGTGGSPKDGTPNNTENPKQEWDTKDTSGEITADNNGDGVPDGDDIPDNFFFVTDPAALESALTTIFNTIIERVSSGTAAAVVANDQQGTGAVFQALYDPVKKDGTDAKNEVEWIGTLHALWVDTFGFIREDAGVKGKLEGYDTDQVVDIFYDELDQNPHAKIRRFTSASSSEFIDSGSEVKELVELRTLWNARERLSDLDEATVIDQRAYDASADEGRYVLTWIDDDLDGAVGADEVVDFTAASIDSTNFRWLDQETETAAERLVDWTRGKDAGFTEFRNRLVDYNADGSLETENGHAEIMRLGDIINSTPVPVGAPAEAYDLLALDLSYAEFRAQYRNRRQVVYVGANDGMLRAFNAGFFDVVNQQFQLELNGETEHPLGAEIWAYVPTNLLPHLQWFARKDYSHVYYMDLTVRTFDAKIFAPDDDHPNGWGTVLVAGMRFGGGTDDNGILLDTGNDGLGAANADGDTADDVLTKSSYVVIDITNPEKPPVILAELSPPNLHHTTSFPQVVAMASPTDSSQNEWFLVFGTGPSDLGTASYTSGSPPVGPGDPPQRFASLFVYDLKNLDDGLGAVAADELNGLVRTMELDEEDVFIGDAVVSDFDIDMKAEGIYFGTVGAPLDSGSSINQGTLYRVSVGETEDTSDWIGPFSILSNVDKPFISQPSLATDEKFNRWVIAASGRLYVNDDKSTDITQTMFGIIDPNPDVGVGGPAPAEPPRDATDLVDVSNVVVFENGDVEGAVLPGGNDDDTTFDGLITSVEDTGGWKRNYNNLNDRPSQRSVNRATLIDGVVFATAFTPSEDLCGAEGNSELLGLFFKTGTPTPSGIFGTTCAVAEGPDGCPDDQVVAIPSVDLGAGLSSTPSIHIGDQEVPGKVTVVTQGSTGAIDTTEAETLGGIKNGEISWREYRGSE